MAYVETDGCATCVLETTMAAGVPAHDQRLPLDFDRHAIEGGGRSFGPCEGRHPGRHPPGPPAAPVPASPMSLATVYVLFRFFRRLGPIGLFILGALDSSFLFLPFGNDLLLIAGLGLALLLVGRVHVGGLRRKLGGAGVHALVDRAQPELQAPLADRFYVMEHGRIVQQFEQRELAERVKAMTGSSTVGIVTSKESTIVGMKLPDWRI